MYCSGEYSKYRVQVKIQLQTDNKLNVQLLDYPPIYEANRTVECQTNPSNTKHHKIQNQGKKEMGLHPVSPLSFCTSSGSPTLERFLPFFLPTTHPIPSYNTFTFFIQHSDVKKKSSFIQHSDANYCPQQQWKHLTICLFRHITVNLTLTWYLNLTLSLTWYLKFTLKWYLQLTLTWYLNNKRNNIVCVVLDPT